MQRCKLVTCKAQLDLGPQDYRSMLTIIPVCVALRLVPLPACAMQRRKLRTGDFVKKSGCWTWRRSIPPRAPMTKGTVAPGWRVHLKHSTRICPTTGPPSPVPSNWTSASSGPGGCAPTLLTCDPILSLFCPFHVLNPSSPLLRLIRPTVNAFYRVSHV